MGDTKHTPGPWQGCLHLRADADKKCGCGYRGGIWSTTADVQVCEMAAGRAEGDDMIPVSDRATQIADHWLIAAAPDLYEALAAMEAEKADYMRLNNLVDPAGEHTNKMARAALAKARGEA